MRVSRLYLHPVKSCRGIAVAEAQVVRRGFADDRRWMVVDWDGRFVTAREDARLVRVRTALDDGALVLDAPGAPTLRRPLAAPEGRRRPVKVWKDECEAVQDDEASAWIGEVLGGPYAMVYMPDDVERRVREDEGGAGEVVSFSDGFPFLLLSEASLDGLNARLPEPLAMERFRPNVVIEGGEAHVEDELASFEVAGVRFRGAKLCSRCVLTTVDPETAEKGPEPLRTLREYRTVDRKVMFGMNLLHDGTGTIRVGDPLAAVTRTPQ